MMWRVLFFAILAGFVGIRGHWRSVWVPIPRQGVASARERLLTSGMVFSQLIPAALWLVAPATLSAADLPIPSVLRMLGFGIALGALGLLWWVHASLGAEFSPRLELRDDHTLIQHGPYRWVRHPMYTTGFLLIVGYGLLAANGVVLGLPLLALLLLVVLRLPDEEAMLARRFGADFDAHRRRTGRFVPRLW